MKEMENYREHEEIDALFSLARRKIADIDVGEIRKRVEAALAVRPMWFAEIIREPLQAFSSRSTHVGVRHAA